MILAILGGILLVLGVIVRVFSGKIKPVIEAIRGVKTDEQIIKEIHDKNPPIKSKQDVLEELNRYRADN